MSRRLVALVGLVHVGGGQRPRDRKGYKLAQVRGLAWVLEPFHLSL
jgi:hypothetical protein